MTAEFTSDKPIYMQLLDYCMDCIGSGQWLPDGRIPSVKELAMTMAVNPRTVMRAYEELTARNLIYQRRGMGFFVTPDAVEVISRLRLTDFEANVLPDFISRLQSTGYPVSRVIEKLKALSE